MNIMNLLCEYRTNPLGIDPASPRLSWRLDEPRRGARQTAYQINVECEGQLVWDSGKVASDQSVHVDYGGPRLRSRQLLSWKVRAWETTPSSLSWIVTVPPNTTATIWVPADEGAAITESGLPVNSSVGVTFIRHETGASVFELIPGTYQFLVA